MKLIVPVDESNVVLIGSTAPISDYPVWNSTTAYAAGSRVYHMNGSIGYDYEALEAVTGGSNPLVDSASATPRWARVGFSNRYKVFDRIVGDPSTTETGSMSFTFGLSQNVTSVAIFGMVGSTIRVRVLDNNGTLVPGAVWTENIVDSPNVANWFDYFFGTFEANPDIVFPGIPGYASNRLEVTITAGDHAEIGEIVFGQEIEIGTTLEKPTFGIRDYSRKERDEFGRPIIIERPFSLYGEFDIVYPSARTRNLLTQLAKLRATPVVYYVPEMDTGRGAMIFGYFTDFSMNLEVGPDSYASITVEGLV